MKNRLLFFSLLAVVTGSAKAQEKPPAPQFLSWEHSLVTRSSQSKHAIAKLKIYNNWTTDSHRLLVKYNVSGLGATADFMGTSFGPSFSMPSFAAERIREKVAYHHGALGIVQNLADDRLIAYSSEAGDSGEYFVEKRKALMKRLRFDPWKKIAPELSKEDVPRLSAAQRARLGREVRALTRPMLKDVLKTYFRALPNNRTFDVGGQKIEARGYRMTALLNAGDAYQGPKWMRLNFEWWLAGEMEGDAVARRFLGQLIADYRELGGFTTSMWLNETLPLMWASMPQELHLAMSTLLPQSLEEVGASTPLALGGTPLYIGATIMQPKPKMGKCPECGQNHVELSGQTDWNTIRMEMQLQNRSTSTLAPTVFDAPPQYKKESIEPILKDWEEGVEMIQSMFDEEVRLSDASTHAAPRMPVYTFGALKNYLAAAQKVAH